MRSRVFVVQDQQHYDHRVGKLVPKFDLTKARTHGDIQYLLGPSAGPWSSNSCIEDIKRGLKNYNADSDFLLLIGNPCLIGWAVAIAAQVGKGRVNLLQWSGRDEKYLPIYTRGLAL